MKICSYKIYKNEDKYIVKIISCLEKRKENEIKKMIENICKNYEIKNLKNNSLILESQIFSKKINIKLNDNQRSSFELDKLTKELTEFSKEIINSKENFNLKERE